MDYYVKGSGPAVLEARITIVDGRITLHSRSGRARTQSRETRGRNPDYVAAFDTIFNRLAVEPSPIERVLLDSARAQQVPVERRVLATREDFETNPLQAVKNQIRLRMRAFGRSQEMPANEGNQNKKILIETSLGDEGVRRRLRVVPISANQGGPEILSAEPPALARVEPLPTTELRKVQPEHITQALRRLDHGDPAKNFGPSRDYDVWTEGGKKYAPKKVFGFALEEALGIDVKSGHFKAGWGTPCFEILEDNGLWITPRQGSVRRRKPSFDEVEAASKDIIPTEEERSWIEGNPKIATHLKKERSPGLAARKRAQFILDNGKLKCERCGLDPLIEYGEEAGQACIEVHHHRTHVAHMQPEHETSLDDLRCLCSNCHRVLHRALSLGLPFDV